MRSLRRKFKARRSLDNCGLERYAKRTFAGWGLPRWF